MGGWPYNLYDGNVDENGFSFGSFKTWFSETTVAGAYGSEQVIFGEMDKSMFSPQDGKNMLSNNVFQMLVVAPLDPSHRLAWTGASYLS